MKIINPKGTRKKGRCSGAVFLGLLLWCLCTSHTASAQLDTFVASDLHIYPYIELEDTIAKYGKDTVYGKFCVTFAATDICQIKSLHFSAGTSSSSADILADTIVLDSVAGGLYTEGFNPQCIGGQQVTAVIRMKFSDLANVGAYWVDIYDKNNILLQRMDY